MWLRPRLVDLITAHLDTPLIPNGLGALSNGRLLDSKKDLKEIKGMDRENKKIKQIKTDLVSNGALGGMCVF